MRIISILFIFFVLGSVQLQAQNSGFTAVNSSQCPGNLFTLSADDNSLATYSWTITEQGGGSSTYNVNPIAFVLTNPGLYDVSLTVSDGVTPSTTTEIGFLEVFDIPTIDYSVTSAPYCEPATVDFINNSTPGSGTIIGYQLFTDGTAYDTEDVQHTYATTGTYSVNVSIENSNGCSSSDDLADIVVSTNPALTSPLNPNTICSGSAFNYTPTSSIAGSTFSWVRLANPDISEAVSSGNGIISETLTNTSGSNTSVTYQVTNTSPTGCAVIENVIVTVQALPTVTINSLNVCTGSTGVLTATPSVGGGNYLWSTSEVSQSITVSAAGVYSVTYSVGSCASAPASVTVTETAPPVLTGITVSESSGLINDDGSICELDNVDLTALPSSGSGTYSWSNSASTSSISVSPSTTTTYSVTYTEGGCASAAVSQTIIVNSLPVPNYNATVTNGCIFPGFNPDITTDYTSTATGTISWQFPGGSPNTGSGNGPISVIYSAEGIYDATMTIVSLEGCETTTTFNNTIAVVEGLTPTSNFSITNTSPQCVEGNSFCFEYTGFNADTIAWDFGDGSPIEFADESSTVCHTFGSINTFTVSIIPYTTVGSILGCSGGGTSLDVTTLGPQAAFDVDPFDCDDQLNRSFTSTSIGTSATTLYTWDFGDPPSPTVTGVSSTSHLFSAYSPSNVVPYVVSLTVEDPATGCPLSTVTQDVYAFPNDQADFVMYTDASFTQATNEVCLNDILWFVNETPLPQNTNPSTNSVQTQWDWNLSNGIQWFGNSQYRGSPEDLDFSDSNPSSYTGGVTWTPGVYDVAMRNTSDNNGSFCYDTVIKTLTVHGIIGSFSLPDTVCIGDVFSLTDNSTAPITSIVQREWDWESDGVIDLSGNDPNPSHSFSAPGVYTVSLTCTDGFGCPQTFTEQIVVRSVVASFNVDRTFICDDEEVTVTANNSSSYGPLTYTWSAATNVTPNTSTVALPGTFLFNDEGNHTITLSVIDNLGCADNTTTDIEVFDVVADGSGNPNIATCFNPPTVVTFTNSSSNNVDPNSIFWDFGNGETSTENSPTTIYTTAGSFPVSLTVESLTGGCTSTVVVETIEVAGPFGAISVTSPVLDDCSCLDVDIDITTSDVAEATLLFGDGSFQNVSLNASETINHQYCNTGTTSQTFTPILYIASGTCNGNITANESVTIQPLPTVDNPGDFEYCEGDNSTAINFTGNIGSTTYNWTSTNTNTGINTSGTGDIPSFITTNLQAASDEVSVITVTPVIDATGCVGVPQDFSITVKKAPVVNAGADDEVCEIDNFTLNGSFGGGASSAQWSGGLGSYSPDNQDMSAVYTPSAGEIAAGSVVFTLTTDDPIGVCSAATDVMVLTINAGVIVNAGVDEEICSNDVFTTSGTIGGSANSAEWSSSGLGTFTTATDLVTTYIPHPDDIAAGSVVLTLSTDDPPGPCFLSSDDMVLSFSNAATISASAPTEICVGETIALNAVMGGTGTTATWSNGSGSFSPNANNLNPIYTPTNTENSAGTVSLIITVDDPDGAGPCLDVSDQVDVALNDTVDVDAGIDVTICSNDTYTLSGSIGGSATTLLWTTDGTGSFDDANLPNAIYTPSAGDLALGFVTLTITTDDPVGPCIASSDDMVLSFSTAATVDISSPSTGSCNAATVSISSSIGGAATSITWSGGNGIYSPNINTENIDYTPTVAEIGAGGLILTATTNDPDGAGPCLQGTDDINIVIATDVLVDAGTSSQVCSNIDIQLAGSFGGAATSAQWSGGNGSYIPNNQDVNALYTPTSAEIAVGSITLTLTTDDPAGPCIALSDDVTFTFESPATVDANSDATVCSNASIGLNGSFGGTASSASWSSSGTGAFDDINSLTATYTPSVADLASGFVTLTLTTDDPAGICSTESDDMILTINEAATLAVTSPVTWCIGDVITLDASIGGSALNVTWSNGGGLFTPNVNTVSPDYIPSSIENAAGSVSLIIVVDDPDGAGPCISLSDQIDITLNDTVEVAAGPDASICSDSDITLNGSIGGSATSATWTSNGSGVFDDPNLLNATYTPSVADLLAGSISLTLTTDDPAGQCDASSDVMVLTISEAASLSVTTPLDECIGQTILLNASIGGAGTNVTWTNGGGLFTPNVNSLTPIYTPSTAENTANSVLLTVTVDDPDGTGPCLSISDQVDIALNDTVTVSAGLDQTVCSDDDIFLNGSIGGSATSGTWTTNGSGTFDDPGLLNATYTPSAADLIAGDVDLILTTDDPVGPCNPNFDMVSFTFVEVPTADAGVDQDICAGQTVGISATIGGTATTSTWSSAGTGTFDNASSAITTYTPSAVDITNGTVTITLSTDDPSGVCGVTTDDVVINIYSLAIVNAGVDQTICSDDNAALGGTLGGSATSASWSSSGTGTFIPDANALNANYAPSAADISNGTVILTLLTNDPTGPCDATSDQLTITIEPEVVVDAGIDITSCSGIDVPLNGSISGGLTTGIWSGGLGVYTPSSTDPNAVYTPTAAEFSAGTVTLTLTSDNPAGVCPSNTDDLLISFSSSATVSAGSDEVICEGDDVILNGSVGGSAVSATWSGSAGVFAPGNAALNPTFTPSLADIANGSVILTITSNDPAGPCTASTDQMEIIINPTPNLSSSLNFDACSGLPVDYPITSAVPSTFSWQAQSDQPNLTGESLVAQNSANIDDILINNSGVVQPINYLITATASGTGCISADQIVTVNVNLISSMSLPADQSICMNDNTSDVLFSGSDPLLTFEWTNDNPSIGLPSSGAGDILSFTGLNATAVNQIATITVTPLLDGCPGTPQVFIIEVYPNSTVDDPLDQIACDGVLTTNVVFTGSDPGITYTWTNNNASIGLANNGAGDILAFTAQNSSNNSVTATVTVTPSLNSCPGDAESFDIIVNPSPEMVVPVDQTICVTNNTTDVIFASNVVGATYSWVNDNPTIGLGASGNGDILSFTTQNSTGLMDTANITVTPNYNGCDGPSISFQIIITPILQVDPISSDDFCAGDDFLGVTFTGNVLTTVYEWTNDNTSIGLASSGTGNISGFTLENSGTVDQIATITVNPVLPGCTGISEVFTITVKPVPTVAVLPLTQELCHDEPTLPVDFSGNIATADYDWTNDNISIGIGSPGFGDIPSFTATNTGLVSETANFLVTPSFNGCTGESETFTITVNPKPTVFPTAPQELCAGELTNDIIFNGNFGLAATYNWTNDNVSTGIPASGTGDILSFIAQNVTADVQIATITVIPTLNGCDGIPETVVITIKPMPTIDGPIPSQALCVNTASNEVVFTGNIPLTTNYNWVNDNVSIGLGASGVGDIPSFIAQNTGNTVITSTVTVTPELNGCIGSSVSFTITTVDPIPVVVDPADQLLCEGELTDDVIFTGPNPTTSFIWTNDNTSIGLAANGTGDILAFTADNTSLIDQDATITVTPEFNGCLGNSQTFLITVKPKPNAFATPAIQEYCSGQNSDEIFFTGDLAGTQYDWSNDNVSIGLSASGIGDIPSFTVINSSSTIQTSTINVIPSFNGCDGDEITATIVVNPISTVVVSSGIDEYCHNDPTLDYIFNGSSGTSTYNWVNDNTSIGLPAAGTGDILSFTAINTDLVNQIATITVEPVLNGCVGVTQVFQILVKPIPTVDAVPNQNICANDDTDAILFEGTMNDTTVFGWTHDNVSIGLSSNGTGDIPSFVASNISQDIQEGNITVTPILNGCIGTAETVTITVNPISTVNAVSDTVCAGEIVPQIDFTGNNASSVYTWVNDNNSIGLGQTGIGFIPAFVAENLGTTTQDAMIVITPSVNGCPGINDTIHIVVYPTPTVDPIGDLEYCAEQSSSLITFTGNMAINQYDWINDNAAIGLVGSGVGDINSYTTTNTGTTDLTGLVTVTPIANGCTGASEEFSIIVHPLPNVDAGLDTTLCFNQSITLTATGAISYAWDNGVINGVEFSPNSTITYNVIGTDANLCQNTDDITVTYLLDIPPVVDAGPDQAICLTDDVTLTAGGDAILYQWNNGVQDGIPFAPIATDTYVVIGTAANGCLEADTVEVVVNPLPVITANASDDFICDGESTILWGEGANTYIWDQGVLDSVSFVPAATATYTVIGYDNNGCTDTTDIEVIVNPLPNVLFSTDMTYGGCIPFSPTFTDLTEGPSSNEVLWMFGNGASSTQMGSVINTYDSYGCYNVTLISTTAEGCVDSLTQDDFVCVNEVMASFYPDVYEQSVINPIFEFTNESENATSFEWFFGDGTESDFVNTTHFYDSYGVYNVALVAMAEDGCTDTAYVAITVNDEVLFYVPNSFTPNGDGKNEVFIPVLTAGYDRDQGYEFSVYNRWGEQIFFSETPGEGWDGTYNSAPAQNGTYIWYVKFKDSMNNLIYNHSGHFNLIK